MVLQDIMDQYDIEEHFDYAFSMYCNFLEREGKWNLCENNVSKNNFRCRMRKVHKGDIDKTKEYKKFELWIEKRKVQEQKDAERRAIKLSSVCEEKDKEELLKRAFRIRQLEEEVQSLKDQLKNEYKLRMELMEKYDSDSD